MAVLVWLMDDRWVLDRITDGLAAMGAEVQYVTLTCSRESLISRWKNDRACEWRTDRWLEISLASLPRFAEMDCRIDTSELSAERIAERILSEN